MYLFGVVGAAIALAQSQWVPLNSQRAKEAQGHSTSDAATSAPEPAPAPAQKPVAPPLATPSLNPLRDAAEARQLNGGPILWRNVTAGMSASALRRLFPVSMGDVTHKSDRTILGGIPIIDGCKAKVNIMHPGGTVSEIVMRGEGSIAGRCSLKIITALSGKYGEPLDKDKVRGSLFAREGKNYVWVKDGVTLQFKRYTSGALGGAGILAASWELRYSTDGITTDL